MILVLFVSLSSDKDPALFKVYILNKGNKAPGRIFGSKTLDACIYILVVI
jgi:hypothetical protein